MKHIILFIFFSAIYSAALAQMNRDAICRRYQNNIVRIGYQHKKDSIGGQGFIVAEKDDTLYIVTAEHVIRSSDAPDIVHALVTFYDLSVRQAVIKYEGPQDTLVEHDIAILAVPKPRNYTWVRPDTGSYLHPTTPFFFIQNREDITKPQIMKIEKGFGQDEDASFKINLEGANEGDSGSAVWSYEAKIHIAGMLTQTRHQHDNLCDAIAITKISSILAQYCHIKLFN